MEIVKKNVSIEEASEIYGLSVSMLYKLSSRRAIPLLKVGSRVLIPIKDFEEWLAKHKVEFETGGKQ